MAAERWHRNDFIVLGVLNGVVKAGLEHIEHPAVENSTRNANLASLRFAYASTTVRSRVTFDPHISFDKSPVNGLSRY